MTDSPWEEGQRMRKFYDRAEENHFLVWITSRALENKVRETPAIGKN